MEPDSAPAITAADIAQLLAHFVANTTRDKVCRSVGRKLGQEGFPGRRSAGRRVWHRRCPPDGVHVAHASPTHPLLSLAATPPHPPAQPGQGPLRLQNLFSFPSSVSTPSPNSPPRMIAPTPSLATSRRHALRSLSRTTRLRLVAGAPALILLRFLQTIPPQPQPSPSPRCAIPACQQPRRLALCPLPAGHYRH